MKKMTLFLLIALLPASAAVASDYIGGGEYEKTVDDCSKSTIYRELDDASRRGRAVTTIIRCRSQKPSSVSVSIEHCRESNAARCGQTCSQACGGTCGNQGFEKVVDRKYYVQETREVYRPVVNYVSAGTYTTTRRVK
jgi:hypothetical protein